MERWKKEEGIGGKRKVPVNEERGVDEEMGRKVKELECRWERTKKGEEEVIKGVEVREGRRKEELMKI